MSPNFRREEGTFLNGRYTHPKGDVPKSFLVRALTERPHMGNTIRTMDLQLRAYQAYKEGHPPPSIPEEKLVISYGVASSMAGSDETAPLWLKALLQPYNRRPDAIDY